jgi:formylglycine-generating enzyme
MNMSKGIRSIITAAALLGLAGAAQAAFITIGDAGNEPDPANGGIYGDVAYTYQISATEVTIAEFAASGAGNNNENYWDTGGRSVGTSAPAVNVSLYEAMKYCNWRTSGNVNDGAYVFSGGVYQSTDRDSALSSHGTVFALPTEDEWYKAAYYTGNSDDLWSLYATGTDGAPTKGGADGWNYDYANSYPNHVWTVGLGGEEQNGTFNMMGNVREWMETSSGMLCGGGYSYPLNTLSSSYRVGTPPSSELDNVGFRVVAIPEPTTTAVLGLGLAAILLRRRLLANRLPARRHDACG